MLMIMISTIGVVSFNIPLSERLRPTVVMKTYVQHMMDHDIDFQQGCQQCVTRFQHCPATAFSARYENHSRQHKEVDSKWKIVRKSKLTTHLLKQYIFVYMFLYLNIFRLYQSAAAAEQSFGAFIRCSANMLRMRTCCCKCQKVATEFKRY